MITLRDVALVIGLSLAIFVAIALLCLGAIVLDEFFGWVEDGRRGRRR